AAVRHDERDAAQLGRLAVRMDRDDGLELLVVDEQVATRPDRTQADVHVLEDAVLAKEDAAAADLERAVLGPEVGQVVPQRLVDVVAVGALHDLDLTEILEPLDALAERHDLVFELLELVG